MFGKDLEKITKLLRKGDRLVNANEAEAMACIDMAYAIADKNGWSIEEIKQRIAQKQVIDGFKVEMAWSSSGTSLGWCDKLLAMQLCSFCHVFVRFHRDEDMDLMTEYFGEDVQVEYVMWLRDTISEAMKFDWETYRDWVLVDKTNLDLKEEGFVRGIADRLSQRMRARMNRRHTEKVEGGTGRDLMVLKNAILITAAEIAKFEQAKPKRRSRRKVDGAAYRAGYERGDNINLGRGISNSKTLKITQY